MTGEYTSRRNVIATSSALSLGAIAGCLGLFDDEDEDEDNGETEESETSQDEQTLQEIRRYTAQQENIELEEGGLSIVYVESGTLDFLGALDNDSFEEDEFLYEERDEGQEPLSIFPLSAVLVLSFANPFPLVAEEDEVQNLLLEETEDRDKLLLGSQEDTSVLVSMGETNQDEYEELVETMELEFEQDGFEVYRRDDGLLFGISDSAYVASNNQQNLEAVIDEEQEVESETLGRVTNLSGDLGTLIFGVGQDLDLDEQSVVEDASEFMFKSSTFPVNPVEFQYTILEQEEITDEQLEEIRNNPNAQELNADSIEADGNAIVFSSERTIRDEFLSLRVDENWSRSIRNRPH